MKNFLDLEDPNKLPPISYIDPVINPAIHHWSGFRCGSYTSEWVSRAVGIQNLSSNRLLFGPVWFDLFRPVIPSDMRKLFKAKGMDTVEVRLGGLSREDKFRWIKTEIFVNRRPPVLLIRTMTLHWIAVGGYDDTKQLFYIYDARYGADSLNVDLPIGNVTISYDDLMELWSGRWFLSYVAIVVSSVNVRDLRKEKVDAILSAFARGELRHQNMVHDSQLRDYDRTAST